MATYGNRIFTETLRQGSGVMTPDGARYLTIMLPDPINSSDLLSDEQVLGFADDQAACGTSCGGKGDLFTCSLTFDPE